MGRKASALAHLEFLSTSLHSFKQVSDLPTAWKIVSSRILPCTSDVILKGILNLLSVCPTILGSSAIETVGFFLSRNFVLNFSSKSHHYVEAPYRNVFPLAMVTTLPRISLSIFVFPLCDKNFD